MGILFLTLLGSLFLNMCRPKVITSLQTFNCIFPPNRCTYQASNNRTHSWIKQGSKSHSQKPRCCQGFGNSNLIKNQHLTGASLLLCVHALLLRAQRVLECVNNVCSPVNLLIHLKWSTVKPKTLIHGKKPHFFLFLLLLRSSFLKQKIANNL